jgi:hypothetical protein
MISVWLTNGTVTSLMLVTTACELEYAGSMGGHILISVCVDMGNRDNTL